MAVATGVASLVVAAWEEVASAAVALATEVRVVEAVEEAATEKVVTASAMEVAVAPEGRLPEVLVVVVAAVEEAAMVAVATGGAAKAVAATVGVALAVVVSAGAALAVGARAGAARVAPTEVVQMAATQSTRSTTAVCRYGLRRRHCASSTRPREVTRPNGSMDQGSRQSLARQDRFRRPTPPSRPKPCTPLGWG